MGEQAANFEIALVTSVTSEKHHMYNAGAGIHIHFEEAVKQFVLEPMTVNKQSFDICLLAAFKKLVIRTLHEAMNTAKIISRLSNAVNDNPGIIV